MAFVTFLIALTVLLVEGWLLARLLLPQRDYTLQLFLALPLAGLSNVLLFFLYTIAKISLTPLSLGLGHACIIIALACAIHQRPVRESRPARAQQNTVRICFASKGRTAITTICLLLLINITAFSFSHALLLPTFSIDSFTNWTMRSKISFVDRSIAFDTTEERGMAKPQYPFLVHALQIAANEGQSAWNDRAANAVTWLLSFSSFMVLFLMLKRRRGADTALLTLTLILSIPLISIHLAQGYGDIHLIEYLLLSLTALATWKATKQKTWLVLSAIFIVGALWTKSEGVFFGLIPWAFLLLVPVLLRKEPLRPLLLPIASALALFLPFIILLIAKDLPITPHGTDISFGWHPEGLAALWSSLFGFGSFGIIWYVLPITTILLLVALQQKSRFVDRQQAPLCLWGWLIVVENMIIYLFTPNVRFLLNGESFSRQMLPAAALLILAIALVIRPNPNPNPNPPS